ncbi:MAG TPA: hypothetical protein VMT34_07980 [Aggregatilineales bacterium]|nr:hypothetical protein [Aggregatilineales bacterium]
MSSKEAFIPVFDTLRAVLQPFEGRLIVTQNTSEGYSLNTPYSETYRKDVFAGAVQNKKNYVSFYLMPVYMYPYLLEGMSAGLRKRMQGKSCLNFTKIDEPLQAELTALTRRAFDRFAQEKLA